MLRLLKAVIDTYLIDPKILLVFIHQAPPKETIISRTVTAPSVNQALLYSTAMDIVNY